MTAPVVYLAEARADMEAAYATYEKHRPGLGDRFLERLRQGIDAISAAGDVRGPS
jgi:hypothetical protein